MSSWELDTNAGRSSWESWNMIGFDSIAYRGTSLFVRTCPMRVVVVVVTATQLIIIGSCDQLHNTSTTHTHTEGETGHPFVRICHSRI